MRSLIEGGVSGVGIATVVGYIAVPTGIVQGHSGCERRLLRFLGLWLS